MAVVVTDITAQKRAEAKLQQNRDELQAIYDGVVDGLLIADVETTEFVRANASICKMLGYSEHELLSMSVADIHPPEDVPAVMESFRAGARTQSCLHENMPVLRKDGSVFYADIGNKRHRLRGPTLCDRLLSRRYGAEAGPSGPRAGTTDAQAPAAIQRPRTATDRL